MDRTDILAAIWKQGWSLSQLAADAGVARQYLSHALRAPNPRGEKVILDFLKLPGHQVWPDRYAKDGARLVRPGGGPRRGQKRGVAA